MKWSRMTRTDNLIYPTWKFRQSEYDVENRESDGEITSKYQNKETKYHESCEKKNISTKIYMYKYANLT